jgi:hypothetical protein
MSARIHIIGYTWSLLLLASVVAEESLAETASVAATDAFLIRQMQWFNSVRPVGQPPLVQTFGWDTSLAFPPAELNPPLQVSPPYAQAPRSEMAYRGDVYDQALAAIWFTERGRQDFAAGRDASANLGRAKDLLDAGIFLADHDPFGDERLRQAYYANNLLNPQGTESSIMAADASTGNIAYFGIALTRFYRVAEQAGYLDSTGRQVYLDEARGKAQWIVNNCTDAHPIGFTGGYKGWTQIPFTWKSTEHNLDAWVLAQNLYSLTAEPAWYSMAQRAAGLVQAMYVPVDELHGYYRTGTLEDGITPNPSPIPADAQAWTALARSNGVEIDTDERAEKAMQWLFDNLQDGSESVAPPRLGVKFSDVGKNMQSEVTASAALALDYLQKDVGTAGELLDLLEWIRVNASPDYDGIIHGIGVAATPGLEGAWTGYGDDAWYYKLLHVASTSWDGMAGLYRDESNPWANPLAPISGLTGDYNRNGVVDAADYTVWRDNLSGGPIANDPTPGSVDESDYLYWKAHFGETVGGGSGAIVNAAVPEPPAAVLGLAGMLPMLLWRRADA